MFGDNDYEEWADFLQEYSPPPYSLPGHTPALSFGVAGPGSGVPFHTHGYNTIHSLSECGFEILKTYQAPAHIWDLPR